MLALGEKVRSVVLLMPDIVLADKVQEIITTFEESYVEVKARKEIFLTEADAQGCFHYLQSELREEAIATATRGLSEVLVIEHLDGDVVERSLALIEGLIEAYGEGNFYLSQDRWECLRDCEFFFPHLDALPVERTLAVLKPAALEQGEKDGKNILEVLEEEAANVGLFIVGKEMLIPSTDQAALLCQEYAEEDFNGAVGVLTSDPGVIAVCLEGRGAVGKLQLLCGPLNSGTARDRAPTTIRANWGTDSTSNAIHASVTLETSEKELEAFFPPGTLQLQRTLCVVKPDAINDLVAIKTEIEAAGFTILKEKQTTLTEERAFEFYIEGKDNPALPAIVKEACSGPCCALVLCRLEAVAVWTQLMGPSSVKEARRVRPHSLRARFGRDGHRNALHGSATVRSAQREIRFFFPEMGAVPIPDEDEIKDFLFRKSALASMDLKTLSNTDPTDFAVDPTLQQLLSKGLMALCQVKPKGLGASKWLSAWLEKNNPNGSSQSSAGHSFEPPGRTKQFIQNGVNADGMPFVVEAPREVPIQKKIVEVTSIGEETEALHDNEFSLPPFIVCVVGGPGCGKGTQCAKLKEDFNLIHLSSGDLMRAEVAAQSYIGTEIHKHQQTGSLVPDDITLKLLKKAMLKHKDTNRFLIDGFPRSLEQAKRFEKEIAEISFILSLEASHETMQARISGRALSNPGRVDDVPETVLKRLKVFDEQTKPVLSYYGPIGKVKKASAEEGPDDVYAQVKPYFSCRFVYLLGPAGCPLQQLGEKLETNYGYSAINLTTLLKAFAKSNATEAAQVQKALDSGKPVEASIACPLVLSEIYRDMALGIQNFVLIDFPQSLKQVQFLEYRVASFAKTLVLDFSRPDAEDLISFAANQGLDGRQLELHSASFFGTETKAMLSQMSNVVHVKCNLAELHSTQPADISFDTHLVDGLWQQVKEKVIPGLTIILGLPHSGADVLANFLAKRVTNTQAVDCIQLLDKELERNTALGRSMQEMLAKGQVVPLSMTLELLKGIVNLTGSDQLIIENCPNYVDQVELIQQDFRIDRVFYLSGTEKAISSWRDAYLKESGDSQAFDERLERLPALVAHFSKLGKLEKFDVGATTTEATFAELVERATMPEFVLVSSLSPSIAAEQAELLCKAYGVGQAVTTKSLQDLAAAQKLALDAAPAEQLVLALQQHVNSSSSPLLVLNGYPSNEAEVQAFVARFGAPKVFAHVACDDEFLEEEAKAADEEADPDQLAAKLQSDRQANDAVLKAMKELSPSGCVLLERTAGTPEELSSKIRTKLAPSIYLVLGPKGHVDLPELITERISTGSGADAASEQKFTVIDGSQLSKRGDHTAVLEDALLKASFTATLAGGVDALPTRLWGDLLTEAFSKSANPMGTFLLTNFPSETCLRAGATIRDLLAVVESVSSIKGILHLKFSESGFSACCSEKAEDFAAYQQFDLKVYDQALAQFGTSRLLSANCHLEDSAQASDVSLTVAKEFFGFFKA